MTYNVNKIIEEAQCVGCGLCANTCPQNAIQMVKHPIGLLPSIDADKCINCGIYYDNCLRKNHLITNKQYEKIFVNSNKLIFDNCTSSGFCTQLADFLMDQGFFIYGAFYDGSNVCIGNIEKK